MKNIWILMVIVVFACTGSLTPEQRKKARKAIEEGQIKRITPAELTEKALQFGKEIALVVQGKDPYLNDIKFIDSLAKASEVKIYSLRKDVKGISSSEIQIAEAYETSGDVSGVADNIQKLEGDTLLYTMPIGNERPDGSKPFSHAIAVKIPVKKIVMSIEAKY
jgi:hypothetical protein